MTAILLMLATGFARYRFGSVTASIAYLRGEHLAVDEPLKSLSTWRRTNVAFRCGMILSLILGTAISARGGQEEISRFEHEFPAAAKRLEERFATVKGACRLWTTSPRDVISPRVDDATFAIDHGFEKVQIQVKLPTGGADAPHLDTVYCVGPGSAFTLTRLPNAKAFVVEGTGLTPKDRAVYLNTFGQFVKAFDGVFGRTMSQVMSTPGFRVTAAERIEKDGETLVKVDYESGGRQPKQQTSVVFDPNAGWAIRSSDLRQKLASYEIRMITDVEYGPSRDGFPMPRRVTVRNQTGDVSICEFVSWSFEPTPEAEFGMPYYGLPDLVSKAKAPRRTFVYWCLGIATVGIVFAVLLRRLATRGVRTSPV
jgi:hypothetical protein